MTHLITSIAIVGMLAGSAPDGSLRVEEPVPVYMLASADKPVDLRKTKDYSYISGTGANPRALLDTQVMDTDPALPEFGLKWYGVYNILVGDDSSPGIFFPLAFLGVIFPPLYIAVFVGFGAISLVIEGALNVGRNLVVFFKALGADLFGDDTPPNDHIGFIPPGTATVSGAHTGILTCVATKSEAWSARGPRANLSPIKSPAVPGYDRLHSS